MEITIPQVPGFSPAQNEVFQEAATGTGISLAIAFGTGIFGWLIGGSKVSHVLYALVTFGYGTYLAQDRPVLGGTMMCLGLATLATMLLQGIGRNLSTWFDVAPSGVLPQGKMAYAPLPYQITDGWR